MTLQGILIIFASSIVFAFVAVWLEDNVFAEIHKCEKCGHDPRVCVEHKK